MKERLYADGEAKRHDSLDLLRAYFDGYPDNDLLNRFLYVDTKVSLVDDMLTKVDRMSMANSLEVRVPLLDHRLVEWMSQVPSSLKVRGMDLKYLFKDVARDLLSRKIVDRRKAGFHVPIPGWIKHELQPLIAEQLSPATVARQGIFNPTYVSELLDAHRHGRENYSRNIWGLLIFSLWYDRYEMGRQ
ncbi:MAG: asparagine synthase C-terminal domain-containing protein [Thermomicrobia bacterium]|nr:asparagine synthase C-terminal domain-containing protein [Thermomicrobia bacterium]